MSRRFEIISGEHSMYLSEVNQLSAALLALRLFNCKIENGSKKKLGAYAMVTSVDDGEWFVFDTQFILDEIGLPSDYSPA